MEELQERVRALERAITDGDHDLSALNETGEYATRMTALEEQVRELADTTAEHDAALQALRGYVGNIRAVNRDVEQRADAALARVESVADENTPRSDSRQSENTFETTPQDTYDTAATDSTGASPTRPHADGRGAQSHRSCPTCGHPSKDESSPPTDQPDSNDTTQQVGSSNAEPGPSSTSTMRSDEPESGPGPDPGSATTSPIDEGRQSGNQLSSPGSRTIGKAGTADQSVLDSVMDTAPEDPGKESTAGPLGQIRNML